MSASEGGWVSSIVFNMKTCLLIVFYFQIKVVASKLRSFYMVEEDKISEDNGKKTNKL
jgi:hypothetical protein